MNFLVRMVAALSAMAAHLRWSQSQRATEPCSGVCGVSAWVPVSACWVLCPSRLTGIFSFGAGVLRPPGTAEAQHLSRHVCHAMWHLTSG